VPFSSTAVPEKHLTADKEEAKNKLGLSSAAAVKTIKKSDLFLDHLVSKLHSVRISSQPAGQDLTGAEIREQGSNLLELVNNFPSPAIKNVESVAPTSAREREKLKAVSKLNKLDLDGQLAPNVLYLLELGVDFKQIKIMAWKSPSFVYNSLERKLKPLVKFLVDLGVSKEEIPIILTKCPQLCGCSIKNNLAPTVVHLERLGLKRNLWPKILCRHPCLLGFSRQKIEATATFLLDMGISAKDIGKILNRCPQLFTFSINDKLRPKIEYFTSFGVDVAILFRRNPELFKLSIESNVNHVTQYFLARGFTVEELGAMISSFGCFYCYSLAKNLAPKWEFFLTMGYPRELLVKFPHYFSYSLEGRIKPRYYLVKKHGLEMKLNRMLPLSDPDFKKALEKLRETTNVPFSSTAVPEKHLIADKEEAKNVLTSFLKKLGLSSATAIKTIKKSDLFLDHLVSKPGGRELTGAEIREALVPYLESLSKQLESNLLELVNNFPSPAIKNVESVAPTSAREREKLKAVSKLNKLDLDGQLAPNILYLLELGMDFKQIKLMAWKCPSLVSYSLERKLKPLVAFLLDLGVSKEEIPTILKKCPQLCGYSIKENLAPTVVHLESLGVKRSLWPKILCHHPSILSFSRQKIEATVTFLLDMGVSAKDIGKVLYRCPQMFSFSIDDKLRPMVEYFTSFGVDVAILLRRNPQLFKLSIESNFNHVTQYFLAKGFSVEELGAMISSCGSFYWYSLAKNLAPKWEFFLTMGYPREQLVKFPHYFSYSLEERIKPRYYIVKKHGLDMKLDRMLTLTDPAFEKTLKKLKEKSLSDSASSNAPILLAGEKQEADETYLGTFLKKVGLSSSVLSKSIGKSDTFTNQNVSNFPLVHKSDHIEGHKFTVPEMRDALVPCLEFFSKLNDNRLIRSVNAKEDSVAPVSPSRATLHLKKLKALPRLSKRHLDGQLPPYLFELGLDYEQIKKMASKMGSTGYNNAGAKIKPLLEFFLGLGMPVSNVLALITKYPQLCRVSIKENIIPTMLLLDNLGVDRRLWGKILCSSPGILTLSRQKMEATVNFLLGMGVSAGDIGKTLVRFPTIINFNVKENLQPKVECLFSWGFDGDNVGKILTRFPYIMDLNVEDKLPNSVEYFRSSRLKAGVAGLLIHNPQAFALSVGSNAKQMAKFLMGRGFSREEIGTIISSSGRLICYSLAKNVIENRGLSLTKEFSTEELAIIESYLECSLQGSITLRYSLVDQFGSTPVPRTLVSPEKEAAKAVLKNFLIEKGFTNAVATRTINKVTVIPFLESLLEQYGSTLVDFLRNFPNSRANGKAVALASLASLVKLRKLLALSREAGIGTDGHLPQHIQYLFDLGMDLDQIKQIITRYPYFAYLSLDQQIRPMVEFLLSLGLSKSDIMIIFIKRPQICGFRLKEDIMPAMKLFENLGMDKRCWPTVINKYPQIVMCSRQKVDAILDFFNEMGLSAEGVVKIFTCFPNIFSYSLEKNLRPTAEYFRSLGVRADVILLRWPQVFGLSVEGNLKPSVEFFLEKGYSKVEVGTMISLFGGLIAYSLSKNLRPKWEFFLTMNYPKEDLIRFPQYFSYSLGNRIKPRYAAVVAAGVEFPLSRMLVLRGDKFNTALERKQMEKQGIRLRTYGSVSTPVPATPVAPEKEAAKAVLKKLLIEQGFTNAVATRTINKDTLVPYLENLLEQYGSSLVNFLKKFPNSPANGKPVASVSLASLSKGVGIGADGHLPQHIPYLFDLGMDLDQIKQIIARYPYFAYLSLDHQIRPMVEFLLSLGLSKSDIVIIFFKRPQICAFSLKEDIMPAMKLFENLGMDKRRWPTVINKHAQIITCSRRKADAILDFFNEMGLSAEGIVKILTCFPNIFSYSLEKNLRPTAEYFRSLGVRAEVILLQRPQAFGLSVEGNLKPSVEFFLEKGYSKEEVGTMISLFGNVVTYSLSKTLRPKWEFFLTMNYCREDLIRFPQYFSYSLEHRIKPRYAAVVSAGVEFPLSRMLVLPNDKFKKALEKKQGIR
ncbi:hypothetical protein Tsubulata_034313, partial [Turnera subulata]